MSNPPTRRGREGTVGRGGQTGCSWASTSRVWASSRGELEGRNAAIAGMRKPIHVSDEIPWHRLSSVFIDEQLELEQWVPSLVLVRPSFKDERMTSHRHLPAD